MPQISSIHEPFYTEITDVLRNSPTSRITGNKHFNYFAMELRTDNRAGILGTYNNVFEYER
jgi:hypothetical protein